MNEGLVEWPPSPWRLLRALVSIGYTKLHWTEIPGPGVELLSALASSLPVYYVPPATAAHSRHYMPVNEGKKVTTTKVIDAFVRTERGAAIGVRWPCALSDSAANLLSTLVERLGYLGRAESRVLASVVAPETHFDGPEVRASDHAMDGCEPVRLLALMSPQQYSAWREERVGEEPKLPKKKGKSRTAASEPLVPPDVVAALEADTGSLQAAGWSDPPGTRHVLYWRPEGAIEHRRYPRRERPRTGARPDTALLALSSDTSREEVLPLFGRALPQAELLHRALIAKLGDPPAACPELSGKDGTGRKLLGHQHVHFVPLDLDGDKRLDHVLLWAPMGFGQEAERAIRSLRWTWTKGGDKPLFVTVAGIGGRDLFRRLDGSVVSELAESRRWRSRTPFVAPRHVKAKLHTIEDQVQSELASRGLPRAARVEISSASVAWKAGFHRFVRSRRDAARRPPSTSFFHLLIELARPVRGPLTLGYGSHFGLGLFVPRS